MLMRDYETQYAPEFNRREFLITAAEEGAFNTDNPQTTAQKVNNQLMYLARLKAEQQIQMHDWTLECPQASDTERALMQAAMETALIHAGFHRAFQAGNKPMLGCGDAFMSFGANPMYTEKGVGFPAAYRLVPTTRLYFPVSAQELRNPGHERSVRRMVRVWEGDWETAQQLYPWLGKHGTAGYLPGLMGSTEQLQQSARDPRHRITQVAEFLDLDKDGGTQCFFGGAAATLGPILSQSEYPYLDRRGEPKLPFIHRKCLEVSQGILNRGIFHMSYKLAVLERILRNMGYSYAIKNMDPVRIVAVSGVRESEFIQKHTEALEAQARLKDGVIFLNTNQFGGIHNMKTEPLIQEMTACVNQLREDFLLWGINLQDALTDFRKTATAIQVENLAQTNFVRHIQRQNSAEMQTALEMFVDWTMQHIPSTCATPLALKGRSRTSAARAQLTAGLTMPDEHGTPQVVGYTYGDLAENLRAKDWQIVMHEDSGVVNSRAYERALNDRMLSHLSTLGITPALLSTLESDAAIDGRQLDLSALSHAAVPNMPMPGQKTMVKEG